MFFVYIVEMIIPDRQFRLDQLSIVLHRENLKANNYYLRLKLNEWMR